MDTVKPRTDFLPAHADQHLALDIDNGNRDVCKLVEVSHEGLDGFGVDDVAQFQNPNVSFGSKDAFQFQPDPLLALSQGLLRLPSFRDIAEYDYRTGPVASGVRDRRDTALHWNAAPVVPEECHLTGHDNAMPLLQDAPNYLRSLFARAIVHNSEHSTDGLCQCLILFPAGQPGCDRVQKSDGTIRIRGQHRVADTRKRDVQPLPLLPQFLLGTAAGEKRFSQLADPKAHCDGDNRE